MLRALPLLPLSLSKACLLTQLLKHTELRLKSEPQSPSTCLGIWWLALQSHLQSSSENGFLLFTRALPCSTLSADRTAHPCVLHPSPDTSQNHVSKGSSAELSSRKTKVASGSSRACCGDKWGAWQGRSPEEAFWAGSPSSCLILSFYKDT